MKTALRKWNSSPDQESPYLPPLNLGELRREAWGPAWDAQAAAVVACQLALAGAEMAAARTLDARSPAAAFPSLDTVSRIAMLLASFHERLLEVQGETTRAIISGLSRRTLKLADTTSARDRERLDDLDRDTAQRLSDMMRSWLEAVSQIQTDIEAALSSPASGADRPAAASRPQIPERRVRSMVISFPDRRMAAG